jgi:hypothetical protein
MVFPAFIESNSHFNADFRVVTQGIFCCLKLLVKRGILVGKNALRLGTDLCGKSVQSHPSQSCSNNNQASMSTFAIYLNQLLRGGAPRRNRWGGFVMSPDTAGAWASRLFGQELHPFHNFHTICKVILNQVRPYRVNFKVIGEVPDEAPTDCEV